MHPTVERQERMVRTGRDRAPRSELQLEDRFRPTAEHVAHHARYEPQVLVEGEHLEVAGVVLVQLADRRGGPVGERDPGFRHETAGLAQVGEHRALVLAVLELAVELGGHDDRGFELASKDLQAARQLRDLDLAVLDAPRRRHQLQVVDDDQTDLTVARLDAPRLGPHLHDRAVRVVVDEERGFGQPTDGLVDAGPLVFGELAGLQLARRHARFGREEALRELEVAHLHREEEHGLSAVQRDVLGHAQRQRGLPLPGARRDDRERRWLHAQEQRVEVVVSGGRTDDVALAVVQRLELIHRLFERGIERHERVGDAPFGDFEDRGFGAIEGLVDRRPRPRRPSPGCRPRSRSTGATSRARRRSARSAARWPTLGSRPGSGSGSGARRVGRVVRPGAAPRRR